MSDTVIKVENLSKRYRLGLIGGKTLRDDVQRWWIKNPIFQYFASEPSCSEAEIPPSFQRETLNLEPRTRERLHKVTRHQRPPF